MDYKTLRNYLIHISHVFNIKVCIHDFVGFVSADKELSTALQPFSIHNNDFCMCIKSKRKLWDKCLYGKKIIAEKLRKNPKPFYGMCHAGVEEFVIPVIYDNQIIAMLNVGAFRSDEKKAMNRIKKIQKRYGIPESALVNHYLSSLSAEVPKIEDIKNLLDIAADYLATAYGSLLSANQGLLNKKNKKNNENYILNHAIEYIKRNYKKNIQVLDIAQFCHCSESYISHIFKSNVGTNINQYINKLRIGKAKILLINTNFKINYIASIVGFNDPNYFSKVFKDHNGISPSKYRQIIRNS